MHDDKAHTSELCRLLTEVARLMREHGSRGEPVRQFIRANVQVPEFKGLAFTLIIVREMFDDRDAERRLLGLGPVCKLCVGEGSIGIFPCQDCEGTGNEPAEQAP